MGPQKVPRSNDATIQFNLVCYEAQMGDLSQAKVNLEAATRVEPRFRLLALEDPDLEPIWSSLAEGSIRCAANPKNRCLCLASELGTKGIVSPCFAPRQPEHAMQSTVPAVAARTAALPSFTCFPLLNSPPRAPSPAVADLVLVSS